MDRGIFMHHHYTTSTQVWRTVKYEVNFLGCLSSQEAHQALTRYFPFDNQELLHQALDYQTLAEVYFHKAKMRCHIDLCVKMERNQVGRERRHARSVQII